MMKLTIFILLVFIGAAGIIPVMYESTVLVYDISVPGDGIKQQFINASTKKTSSIVPNEQPSPKTSMERGKKVFETYCLACHQADGTGVPRLNPPLVKTSFVLGDKKMLIGIVLNGFDQEIEIDGEVFNNVMASHNFLKDQEIADVLTYVRNSFGNKASAVTPAEVAKVRATKKK
jgi:mono/diheme cytochrome c family protein